MDEQWGYVGAKSRQRWLFYAYDRIRRTVVAHVFGERTLATLERLLSLLSAFEVVVWMTDGWPLYESRLKVSWSHYPGNNTNCNSVRFNYNLNTILQVNLMTCGFEDQSIDTGRFVLSRINNENYQFHHIRFDCIQGEQGELVFEPSDVEYYFEPVTIQESGTSILKNELENSEDGAGQIGFQLSNDGTNEIQYGKSNYYSFQHPHEGSNQIPLFIRPRTYGNNVSSGQIMSRVKIVVMYN
ncbi:fimbrial family protein [Escherichia coli]|nr:fimbrial family protein [Escherichia coli]